MGGDKKRGPRHVAIIMDGNGRWAKKYGLLRRAGHEKGGQKVKEILKAAHKLGVEQLTLYAFSTENWKRSRAEVSFLMNLLVHFLKTETEELNRDNVRFVTIGDLAALPAHASKEIARSKEIMKNNTGITLCLALNYGSRQEILAACRKFAGKCLADASELERLDEERFEGLLDTAGMPELDLLIRTSGEKRVSNFLLWQLSYAELYFTRVLWPDFTHADLEKAVMDYLGRDRRFGGIAEQEEE